MKLKNKFVAAICGIGLFFGVNSIVGVADSEAKKFKKDNFNIQLGRARWEGEKFYYVMIWSEDNKEDMRKGYPSFLYEEDSDLYFIYTPPDSLNIKYLAKTDKDKDGWIKIVRKWKKSKDGSLKSSHRTYDTSYKNVPGSPKGLASKLSSVKIVIDFDEGQEYAGGDFANKYHALEWADNMIEIFKSKNYKQYISED